MKERNILFVMLRTLGDVMLATTLVHELKREYPGHRIFFYTNSPYDELLRNNPDIHEVRVSREWVFDMIFMEWASSNGRFDMAFFPYQVRKECNIWHQEEETRHQHLVDFYWTRMGMHRPITERECYIYPSDKDHEESKKYMSLDVPRIALHSTTGVQTKDWTHFDELAEELRKAGYGCVQIGLSSDKPIAGAVDLRGKMSLLGLADFVSKCAAFVGLDSGISYIADAMKKVPTIVIQGSTNPVTSGPISSRVIHLFAEDTGYEDCRTIRCHANCRHERNCIEEVTVDHVLEKLEPILAAWNPPIPARVD